MSNLTQNGSFRKRSFQSIFLLSAEETKGNTTKASDTRTKWPKLTWKNSRKTRANWWVDNSVWWWWNACEVVCVDWLQIKEIAPHTALTPETEAFWKKDIPVSLPFLMHWSLQHWRQSNDPSLRSPVVDEESKRDQCLIFLFDMSRPNKAGLKCPSVHKKCWFQWNLPCM